MCSCCLGHSIWYQDYMGENPGWTGLADLQSRSTFHADKETEASIEQVKSCLRVKILMRMKQGWRLMWTEQLDNFSIHEALHWMIVNSLWGMWFLKAVISVPILNKGNRFWDTAGANIIHPSSLRKEAHMVHHYPSDSWVHLCSEFHIFPFSFHHYWYSWDAKTPAQQHL